VRQGREQGQGCQAQLAASEGAGSSMLPVISKHAPALAHLACNPPPPPLVLAHPMHCLMSPPPAAPSLAPPCLSPSLTWSTSSFMRPCRERRCCSGSTGMWGMSPRTPPPPGCSRLGKLDSGGPPPGPCCCCCWSTCWAAARGLVACCGTPEGPPPPAAAAAEGGCCCCCCEGPVEGPSCCWSVMVVRTDMSVVELQQQGSRPGPTESGGCMARQDEDSRGEGFAQTLSARAGGPGEQVWLLAAVVYSL
jgi:hypothetical protein